MIQYLLATTYFFTFLKMDHLKELFLKERGSYKKQNFEEMWFQNGTSKGNQCHDVQYISYAFQLFIYSSIQSYAYMSGSTCEDLQRCRRPCLYIMYSEQYGSIIHYRPLSILPTGHNATVNMLGLLSYIFPFGKFFFFF